MATRKVRTEAEGGPENVDPALAQSHGVSGDVRPIIRAAKTYTLIALALFGWSLFWFVTLRLLFLQGRFLEAAVGVGLLLLPVVGFLGWRWWSMRRPESSPR